MMKKDARFGGILFIVEESKTTGSAGGGQSFSDPQKKNSSYGTMETTRQS